MDICGTASCDDSFLHSRSRSCQGVFHTEFCFLHFRLCRSADTDDCYAAGQFCQTLLQFLAVKIRCRLFNLLADLGYAGLDLTLISFAVYDDRIFFLNFYRFRAAELIHRRIFQIQSELFRDHFTTGKDRDIFEHLFSSVAIARRFHRYDLERAAQLIQYECAQRLTLYVLCDNEEFRARLYNLLKKRQDLLDVGNLLICNKDIWIFEICFHLIHIRCHISGKITTVKLHSLYEIQLRHHRL